MTIREILCMLPQITQRQDSTIDQLSDLILIANKIGMYDAADTINNIIQNNQHNKCDKHNDMCQQQNHLTKLHYWYSEKMKVFRKKHKYPKCYCIIDRNEVEYTVANSKNTCPSKYGDETYLGIGYFSRIDTKNINIK